MKSATLSFATLTLLALCSAGACTSNDDVRPDDARAPVGVAGHPAGAGASSSAAGAISAAGAAQAGAEGIAGASHAGRAGQSQGGNEAQAGAGGAPQPSAGAAGAPPAPGSKESCARARPGPSMVSITTAAGKSFCIDRHEVTMAQYQEFVTAIGDGPIPKIEGCELNKELVEHPTGSDGPWCDKFKPKEFPDAPVSCVDWCDAAAYCAWAGKRLCGAIGGGQTPEKAVNDPFADEWLYVCTNGGKTKYPYGDTEDGSKCSSDSTAAVDAFPACSGAKEPFSGVLGMLDVQGNGQGEWVDVAPLQWPGHSLPFRYMRGALQAPTMCGSLANGGAVSGAPTSFRCCGE